MVSGSNQTKQQPKKVSSPAPALSLSSRQTTSAHHPLLPSVHPNSLPKSPQVLTVVLPNRTSLSNVSLHPIKVTQPNVVQIQDGTARLDRLARRGLASRDSLSKELLVLVNETFEHPFLSGGSEEFGHVEFAEDFDVDWSAVLFEKRKR